MAYRKSETWDPVLGPRTSYPKVIRMNLVKKKKIQHFLTFFNPSTSKFSFLYPLKISGNHTFLVFSEGTKIKDWVLMGFKVYIGIRTTRLDAKCFLKNSYLLASNDYFMFL